MLESDVCPGRDRLHRSRTASQGHARRCLRDAIRRERSGCRTRLGRAHARTQCGTSIPNPECRRPLAEASRAGFSFACRRREARATPSAVRPTRPSPRDR